MSPTLTTFLFETANFLVLFAALGWLFFKPVRQALVQRSEQYESEKTQADQLLSDAEKMIKEADATKADLQTELAAMRTRGLEEARGQADQIISDARVVARQEHENGHRLAMQVSDAQRDSLAEVAATVAADIVERLLEQISSTDLHSALTEVACQRLRDMPHDRILPVKVESTRPLSPAQVAELRGVLGHAGDEAVFRTTEGLGDGVRVSTGDGLVDASVQGLVHFTRQSLLKQLASNVDNHRHAEVKANA